MRVIIYIFNPFRHRREASICVRVEGVYIKVTRIQPRLSRIMNLVEFNSGIQHLCEDVGRLLGVSVERG